MEIKKLIGWSAILLISFTPAALWYFLGAGSNELHNYDEITHSIGEITGLVGMTMFALTFVLSTRIRFIEDIFGGLDKVYIAHGILGGTALIILLFHPIFLVLKFIPENVKQAAIYLLPSSYWSVNFGILALLGMIALVYLTLFTKIKYHKWKFTHEFLGLVFILALLHIFLVRGKVSGDDIFKGYYIYASAVGLIGLGSFSYSLFLKNRLFKAAKYRVASIRKLKDDVYEIKLAPEHKPISYKSGQFIFVRFYNERLPKESHPFTIASRSNHPIIKIIVKALGDFTSRLTELKVGDYVSVEGPYGRFSVKNSKKAADVWIAGGIGITPFISMAEELRFNPPKNDVYLFYTCRTSDEFVCVDELRKIEAEVPKFHLVLWESKKMGHLTLENIARIVGRVRDKEYYLCGPSAMKRSIIKSVLKNGVKKSLIHVEEFEFR